MGQYVSRQSKIDYAVVSNSLDRAIADLDTRREKQRAQMRMMAEAIAQKRKEGDTRYFNFEVDQYGGVNTLNDERSNSYLDFFKTRNVDLYKEKGENSTTYNLVEDNKGLGLEMKAQFDRTEPFLTERQMKLTPKNNQQNLPLNENTQKKSEVVPSVFRYNENNKTEKSDLVYRIPSDEELEKRNKEAEEYVKNNPYTKIIEKDIDGKKVKQIVVNPILQEGKQETIIVPLNKDNENKNNQFDIDKFIKEFKTKDEIINDIWERQKQGNPNITREEVAKKYDKQADMAIQLKEGLYRETMKKNGFSDDEINELMDAWKSGKIKDPKEVEKLKAFQRFKNTSGQNQQTQTNEEKPNKPTEGYFREEYKRKGPDEFMELEKYASDKYKEDDFGVTYKGSDQELAYDTKDIYEKITKTSQGFNNNQVKAHYNDLMANAMMSNAGSVWGHGSNTELWKSLADKAYEERKAYNDALMSDTETRELIELGGLKYSVGKSGEHKSLSVNRKKEEPSALLKDNKPKDVTFTINNQPGREFKASMFNAEVIGPGGDRLITPVVDIPGINLSELKSIDPNIFDRFHELRQQGWKLTAVKPGAATLDEAVRNGGVIFENNGVVFKITKDGVLTGRVPSHILTLFANINVPRS